MEDVAGDVQEGVDGSEFTASAIIAAVFFNPVNVALVCVILVIVYLMYKSRKEKAQPSPIATQLSPMKKQHMTPQQLKQYDGTNEERRVCIAVNGKIFDVTKGARYYGPGGPYSAFAGKDATRGLATFAVEVSDKEYDDLSDLNTIQMESVKEWEMQFQEKYEYVGHLLKPGESATDYSDDEERTPTPESNQAEKTDDGINIEEQTEESGDSKNKSASDVSGVKAKDEYIFEESVQAVPKKHDPAGDHLDSIEESPDKEEKSQSLSNECQEEAPEEPKKSAETEVD